VDKTEAIEFLAKAIHEAFAVDNPSAYMTELPSRAEYESIEPGDPLYSRARKTTIDGKFDLRAVAALILNVANVSPIQQ
jgi:hypothetical protein